MKKKKLVLLGDLTNVARLDGFDYKLKVSSNYESKYLRGWRSIDFISSKDDMIRRYVMSSPLFENHHELIKGKFRFVKMYPMFNLLNKFSEEILPTLEDDNLIVRRVNIYKNKIHRENLIMMQKLRLTNLALDNKLLLRIPHNSYTPSDYQKYKDSLCIDEETFINLSMYNSDLNLLQLVDQRLFTHIAKGNSSRLLFDLERLVNTNDVQEREEGFSWLPRYAISNKEGEKRIQIRNIEHDYQDPHYFTFLNNWLCFNQNFEKKVEQISHITKGHIFVISLHSFSESYIMKKYGKSRRKYPDFNITFASNFDKSLLKKIKNKIYKLDHKYHFKVSFTYPYNDSYELVNRRVKRVSCMTVEINKKLYAVDDFATTLKKGNEQVNNYLDDLFIYLSRLNLMFE